MKKIPGIFTILLLISGLVLSGCRATSPEHDHDHTSAAQHGHKPQEHNHGHDADENQHAPETEGHDHNHDAETPPLGQETVDIAHEQDANRIMLTAEEAGLIGIKTIAADFQRIELTIPVPGKIITNPNMAAAVSPFINASINKVFKNLGDRVKKGDILACVTSPQIGLQRAEFGKAKAELEIAAENHKRQQRLFNEKIISSKTFQASELTYKVARTNYEYSVKKMLATGIPEAELEQPPAGHSDAVGSTLHITAPISGIITHRNAIIGEKIEAGKKLFEIVDLSKIWLQVDVFEKHLMQVQTNQTVRLRTVAYPDEIFTGKIFYISNTLDPESKSIQILAEIINPKEKLKPGMFADVEIITNDVIESLSVPRTAVLEDESQNIIFVKSSNGFYRQVVETGIETDQCIEIKAGLKPGQEVVVTGNYQLKSKSKMSGIDPHAGHNH